MLMVHNVLTLDEKDCKEAQHAMDCGESIKDYFVSAMAHMYEGGLDDLDGIEIPANYWHFVMELDDESNKVIN